MTEAPETITIFVDYDDDGVWYELVKEGPVDAGDVHYIRADIADAATQAAVVRALEAAALMSENVAKPMTGKVATSIWEYCRKTSSVMIRAIASDPAQVERIAKGGTE